MNVMRTMQHDLALQTKREKALLCEEKDSRDTIGEEKERLHKTQTNHETNVQIRDGAHKGRGM